jgi:hypothetical protein
MPPDSLGTSSWIEACGFVHANSTTVPTSVFLTLRSNITGE